MRKDSVLTVYNEDKKIAFEHKVCIREQQV